MGSPHPREAHQEGAGVGGRPEGLQVLRERQRHRQEERCERSVGGEGRGRDGPEMGAWYSSSCMEFAPSSVCFVPTHCKNHPGGGKGGKEPPRSPSVGREY